jgi:hypothetical protein
MELNTMYLLYQQWRHLTVWSRGCFVLRAAWLLQYCAWANRGLLFSTVSLSMLVLQTKYHSLQLQLVFTARVKFRLVTNIIVLQCTRRAFCRSYWDISGRAEKTASWGASYLSAVFIFSLEWVNSFLRPSRVVCWRSSDVSASLTVCEWFRYYVWDRIYV